MPAKKWMLRMIGMINKPRITPAIRAALVILILALSGCAGVQDGSETLAGCSSDACAAPSLPDPAKTVPIEKLEVYHFHGTHQCYSCKTVGAYAEETVNTYFSDEVASGKIVFGHINGDLPENRELIMKYGVTSASLWLGVYDKNGFHPEQNTNVWYKINDKQEYMGYLRGVIEKRLAGDFS